MNVHFQEQRGVPEQSIASTTLPRPSSPAAATSTPVSRMATRTPRPSQDGLVATNARACVLVLGIRPSSGKSGSGGGGGGGAIVAARMVGGSTEAVTRYQQTARAGGSHVCARRHDCNVQWPAGPAWECLIGRSASRGAPSCGRTSLAIPSGLGVRSAGAGQLSPQPAGTAPSSPLHHHLLGACVRVGDCRAGLLRLRLTRTLLCRPFWR